MSDSDPVTPGDSLGTGMKISRSPAQLLRFPQRYGLGCHGRAVVRRLRRRRLWRPAPLVARLGIGRRVRRRRRHHRHPPHVPLGLASSSERGGRPAASSTCAARGRSTGTAGPFSMAANADDLVSVLDHAGVERATLVGDSMGAFVAVVTAYRHPAGRVVLALVRRWESATYLGPLPGQLDLSIVAAVLNRPGPSNGCGDVPVGRRPPRPPAQHPAFAMDWNAWKSRTPRPMTLEVDAAGDPPELRSGSASGSAGRTPNNPELVEDDVARGLVELRHPAVLVRARPGSWAAIRPVLRRPARVVDAPVPTMPDAPESDVNHGTILLSARRRSRSPQSCQTRSSACASTTASSSR